MDRRQMAWPDWVNSAKQRQPATHASTVASGPKRHNPGMAAGLLDAYRFDGGLPGMGMVDKGGSEAAQTKVVFAAACG